MTKEITKLPDNFYITYYADKHKKIITRKGQWLKPDTEMDAMPITGKVFVSSKGQVCFVYWDTNAEPDEKGNQWRMAKNPMRVRAI